MLGYDLDNEDVQDFAWSMAKDIFYNKFEYSDLVNPKQYEESFVDKVLDVVPKPIAKFLVKLARHMYNTNFGFFESDRNFQDF